MKEKFLNICRVMLGLLGISAVSACNINIEKLNNQSRKDFAYTILDVNGDAIDAVAALNAKDGIYRAYAI